MKTRREKARFSRFCLWTIATFLGAQSVGAETRESQEALLRRYPFDPACPWGRIANGKGMVVRCISEREAAFLAQAKPASAPAASGGAGGATAEKPGTTAGASTTKSDGPLVVTVSPIVADQGELNNEKLVKPKDRYAKCVEDHGGMKEATGEVSVRFLVRSQGIAEGVSVQKHVNVSVEAARCVADIVDRRRVGAPDAPLVGATVVVKFDRAAR